MKKFILRVMQPVMGKQQFQSFFEKLHTWVLYAQNYGISDMRYSGELFTINKIAKYLNKKNSSVVLDIGANKGLYSVALADHLSKNSSIYSFEPSPRTFVDLCTNVKGRNTIHPLNFGLGEKDYKTQLYTNENIPGHASVFDRDMSHWGEGRRLKETEEISIFSLQSIAEKYDWPHIHFMKMDVEGNELNVLYGASDLIQKDRIDIIQFEFGVCAVDGHYFMKDVFKQLTPKYEIYRILKNGFWPMKTYREHYEVFLTSNYLAVRKDILQEFMNS